MPLNEFLRKTIFVLAILSLLTIFLFNRAVFFPYIITKAVYFRLLAEMMVMLYIILAVLDKSFRPILNALTIAVIVFGLAVFLSGIFGVNFYSSFFSTNERMEGILGIGHFILWFLVLAWTIKKPEDFEWLIKVAVLVALVMGFLSFFELTILHKGRLISGSALIGYTGNPSFFGAYLLISSFLSLYLFLKNYFKKNQNSFLWFLAFLALSLFLFLTACRGALSGWVLGLFISLCLFLYHFRKTRLAKILGLGLVLFLVTLLSLLFLIRHGLLGSNPYLEKWVHFSFLDPSFQSRLFSARFSFRAFLDRPVFGWGQDNFDLIFPKYYQLQMLNYNTEFYFDRPHNKLIEIMVDNGAFGLLSYLGLWVILFLTLAKIYKKNYQPADLIFFGLFSGYFWQNLFLFDIFESYLLFFLSLAYVFVLSLNEVKVLKEKKEKPKETKNQAPLALWLLLILSPFVAFYSYQFNLKPYRASANLITALYALNMGRGDLSYEKSLAVFRANTFINREALFHLSLNLNSRGYSIESDYRQKLLNLYLLKHEELLQKFPLYSRLYLSYADLLSHLGSQNKEAELVFEKALKVFPNYPPILTAYFRYLINIKQYEKVVDLAKPLFEANLNFPDFDFFYGYSLYYAGQKEKGLEAIERAIGKGLKISSADALISLANIFKQEKHYETALKLYEQAKAMNPTSSEIETEIQKLQSLISL